MKDTPPSIEGMLGPPPLAELDSLRSAEAMEPGTAILCLAVRANDSFLHEAPKSARVRVTPAFARWALQLRLLIERGLANAAVFEDRRPQWFSCASSEECGEDDERFAGLLPAVHVHVSREGVTWRAALGGSQVPIETEPLCFEELSELVLRASTPSSRRSGGPIPIAKCIPAALTSPSAHSVGARRVLPTLRQGKTKRRGPARSGHRPTSAHKEVDR